MKRAVSISLGSSKRNKAVEVDLLGERVSIERIGTDGDMMASSGARGYNIGSTVSSLRVEMLGSQAEVRCSLSMRVSPWTGRDGNE